MIDPFSRSLVKDFGLAPILGTLVNWSSWALYWHFQGVILAGWWCMAHEAGHGTLSPYNWVNHLIGFSLHSVRTYFPLLIDFFFFTNGPFSSFSYHITHGDQHTMLTTRRRYQLNVTKTLFLELVPIMDSPLNPQQHSPTTAKFSRKHRSILSLA